MPGFFFQSLKTSTPQNQAAADFFFTDCAGHPTPLFSFLLSLFTYLFLTWWLFEAGEEPFKFQTTL
jgi:hypothetical protein